jgi:hypothetical protein
MSTLVQLGEAPSIETTAQSRRCVPIGAVHVQTVTGLRDPFTRRPVAQGLAGVGTLQADAVRLLYTP